MSESKDMVIILTGASRGIGLAAAHYLLKQSHKLVVVSRTTSALTQLRDQYGADKVEIVAGDLSDFNISRRAVEVANDRFGRIDGLLINHGALDPVKKVADSTAEEWRKAFDTNVFSAIALIQASLPSLRKTQGRIIITSSGAAVGAYQGWGAYGAGKAVLNHLALTLAVEEPDVTTISIRPGVVDTEMQREIRELHNKAMTETDAAKFAGLKKDGGLLKPEQPGHVLAKLTVSGDKDLSGKFLTWNDEALAKFQDSA